MKSLRVATILVIMICAFNTGGAQVFEPTAASFGQGIEGRLASRLNPAKSNLLAVPAIMGNGVQRDNDIIPISSAMLGSFLPRIPNLEFGFLYSFGNRVRTGRFSGDYVLPLNLGKDAVLFGEAHTECQGFWNSPSVGASNRWDISLGGGYRRLWGNNLLLGANGFYDTSRLFNQWYTSGGLGLEMVENVSGDDAIDLNLNWYGNLFSRDLLVNAFRNKGNSYDLEAGYSHALFNQTLDLRLKLAGYQFDVGQNVSGWRTGADLTTRDGVFCLRYDYGQDRINGSYNTVGGFVNIGFQVENLLKGENPFTAPAPIFKSPRDLSRMLTQKVKRNWSQPAQVKTLSAIPTGNEPHFELTINPPYWCDGSNCSSGLVEYQSTSGATWRITFTQQVGDDWCGATGGYTVRLVGDTSKLVFPLTVTITPTAWASWINQFTVRQDYGDFMSETTVMAAQGDLVKNIPPDGTGLIVPGEHPRIHRYVFTGTQVGSQGQFTISAPGVTTLVVDIVSTN